RVRREGDQAQGQSRSARQLQHGGYEHLPRLPRALRGGLDASSRRPRGRGRHRAEGLTVDLNQYLILSAFLFCTGIYGVLARKNAVLVLMSIELMLNAVNINLVAFSAFRGTVSGQVFALFVITIAAAEVGVGLAIVLLIYRNERSIDVTEMDALKG